LECNVYQLLIESSLTTPHVFHSEKPFDVAQTKVQIEIENCVLFRLTLPFTLASFLIGVEADSPKATLQIGFNLISDDPVLRATKVAPLLVEIPACGRKMQMYPSGRKNQKPEAPNQSLHKVQFFNSPSAAARDYRPAQVSPIVCVALFSFLRSVRRYTSMLRNGATARLPATGSTAPQILFRIGWITVVPLQTSIYEDASVARERQSISRT
jgi:hypothetical protein